MTGEEKVSLERKPRVIRIQGWYQIAVIGFVMALLGAGNLAWTYRVDQDRQESERKAREAVIAAEREADRRWCELLVPLDDSYQSNPNVQSTELGRRVAAAIHNIRVAVGC
jgi:hypothetical protein